MGLRAACGTAAVTGVLRVRAYAKINLHLRIGPRRGDGYHEIDSILHRISWYDDLELRIRRDGEIRLAVEPAPDADVPATGPRAADAGPTPAAGVQVGGGRVPTGPANLVWRAARLLQEACGLSLGAEIRLVKRIAAGAGLGGGSADAAAVLRALRRLWRVALDVHTLRRLGERLGADVPFLLGGRAARVRGKGERIHPLPAWPGLAVVLVPVQRMVSTAWAYAQWDRWRPRAAEAGWQPDGAAVAAAVARRDLDALARLARNDFEPLVAAHVPEVRAAVDALCREGAVLARMSGSGPVVWGIFAGEEAARRACHRLADAFAGVRLVRTL
ncbi:MAG TPA: 4-(cytidine 5'-diphospho)-2-C-methyl-D-erythritol kinase [Thermaerobacter sp.]